MDSSYKGLSKTRGRLRSGARQPRSGWMLGEVLRVWGLDGTPGRAWRSPCPQGEALKGLTKPLRAL